MRRAMLFTMMLAGAVTATTPAAASPSQASDLESKTVALVRVEGDDVDAKCSGVWVSQTTILTALHCLGGETVIPYVTHDDVYPHGSKGAAPIIAPRYALTYAIDEEHDLALVRAVVPPAKHGIAHTHRGTVDQGMFAQAMGMPLGIWFSYATGTVSAVRVADLGDGVDTLYVQTAVPTSPGCSGGGLFDADGNIIGVTHATARVGQNLNFYVHKIYVDALLRAQGSSL